MTVRKPFLSALVACFGLALFAASCATPTSTTGTGGSGGSGTGSGGTGVMCGAGQTNCSGQCINVNGSDSQNCGACGKACGTGSTCQSGSCVCGSGQLSCNNACVPSDSNNCGTCGHTCTGTQVCANGNCTTTCPSPTMQCSAGACADLTKDINNCGSCGHACTGGSTCTNSNCACPVAGQMLCGTTCVDTNSSNTNCGGCNKPCNGTCTNGTCVTTVGTGGSAGGTGGSAGGTTGTGGSAGGTTGTGGSTGGTSARGGTTGTGGSGTCQINPPPGAVAADVISDFEEGYAVMKQQGGRTGYWGTYNDSADPQNQTPTAPPVAMSDKEPVTPGGMCAGNAFASSATGQTHYVGFGAKFHPNMPNTTSNVGDPYDVSAWDGITFRAKTGGGPTDQPVFVEILTKETQPSTAGGVATNTATDQYNNRGFMADINSSSYQQFFVPFGALIPRSLPAQGSGGNACPPGGTLLCQAPKFVPTNALAIQFSWYGPNDTPGFLTPNPVGSYNVLIDDVAFYKRSALPSGMSDLPALPSNGGAHPLGNPTINSRCTKPTGADGKLLALAYDNWKKRFVVSDSGGFKVIRPENGNDTVSEGIAYGMMIAVYMDDKPLFDGLYTYWKAKAFNGGALMTWCIGNGPPQCQPSGGTATDADEDAAFAMLEASKQWPNGNYGGTATTMINAVMSTDMSGSYIKAGSNYTASQLTNPSYFAPAMYRVFATATGNSAWTTLADNSYTLLNNAVMGRSNGLVAAWCQANGSTLCGSLASNGGSDDMLYQYDSHRIPWRIGMDYCWNGTSAAKTYLDKLSGFFSGKATNGVGRVFDIYQLSGTENSDGTVNSGSAIGTAASGAMSNSSYSSFMNAGYQLVLDLLNRGTIGDRLATAQNVKSGYSYFNATVGMLVLLTMTGNFQAW